jgi:LmbE family N-acetylglucosaminyl deacetylase
MPSASQTTTATAPERVAFFFAAHQDDWPLFMNPDAFKAVIAGSKCVFIHVTAGDGGLGLGSGGRKHPLYLAREHGAESAIRFMADSDNQAPTNSQSSVTIFCSHPIRCVRYRNTAAYFLRLPDGGTDGEGYAATGRQSLKRFADSQIDTLTAVDDTARYESWRGLVATLRAIIDFERGQASTVELHVPELDPARNANDHPDHLMTAKAALEAASSLHARRIHHLGYASGALPENLGGEERDMKAAVYAVTLAGVMALDHPTAWQHYDSSFVGRNYQRVEGETGVNGSIAAGNHASR